MGKAIYQLSVIVLVFFALWFGLSQIDYVKKFHLNELSKKTEKKLGDVLMETIDNEYEKIDTDSAQVILNKLKERICNSNGINAHEINIHLVLSNNINAFALPGNNLIIYTNLIENCDSASELCGVMAHEIGHMQLNHVMKRLAGEIGITLLASVATNGNSKVASRIIRTLSTSSFERDQESEADRFAVISLQKANIDPRGFSRFMLKLAESNSGIPEQLEWISSHPESKKRAEAILHQYTTRTSGYSNPLNADDWATLKRLATKSSN